MSQYPIKPDPTPANQIRLNIQASIPVSSSDEGEIVYEDLKIFIRNYDPKSIMNGQISKLLEPCCKDKKP